MLGVVEGVELGSTKTGVLADNLRNSQSLPNNPVAKMEKRAKKIAEKFANMSISDMVANVDVTGAHASATWRGKMDFTRELQAASDDSTIGLGSCNNKRIADTYKCSMHGRRWNFSATGSPRIRGLPKSSLRRGHKNCHLRLPRRSFPPTELRLARFPPPA